MFAVVGAPLDVSAIAAAAFLSYRFHGRRAFGSAFAGALLLALGLAAWFAVVAPANKMLATWTPGPIPADFNEIRLRWEIGHMIVASFKLAGFVSICLAVLKMSSRHDGVSNDKNPF